MTFDTQCYIPVHPNDVSSLQCLFDYLKDVKRWIFTSFLQVNEAKPEVLLCGPSASTETVANNLEPLSGKLHTPV